MADLPGDPVPPDATRDTSSGSAAKQHASEDSARGPGDAPSTWPATGPGPAGSGAVRGPGPAPVRDDGLAPVADPFEAALDAAVARLPEAFRAHLATVAIVVAEEPTPEELASVGARGLLGLYRGVPRTVLGAGHATTPSVITLYRGPLMRAYRGHSALASGVEETLRHELAHHLGISDRRLGELRRGER